MQAILYRSVALFCCCLAIHIFILRIWRVRSEALWLTLIFLVAPAIILAVYLGFSFGWAVARIEWPPLGLRICFTVQFQLPICFSTRALPVSAPRSPSCNDSRAV